MASSESSAVGSKEMNCEPYMNYDSLPDGHVRLLKIRENPDPQNLEEEIELTITSLPLQECPPYVALSYTWDDPEPFQDPIRVMFTTVPRCFPVKCGGRLVLGTWNLRDALRRLRQYEHIQKSTPAHTPLGKMAAEMAKFNKNVYVYWIDAICIDQDDLHERSNQVSLMSKIYRQAACTMAWLGEQDQYTTSAVQVLLKVVGNQISRDSFVRIGNSTETEPPFEGIDTLDDNEIMALAMLMARKWISRTWILQEVILSPSVLAVWGGIFFSFHVLLQVGAILSSSRTSLRLGGRFSLIAAKDQRMDRLGDINQRVIQAQSTLGMIHSLRLKLQGNSNPNFIDTMSFCRTSQSTDPRDKVYGILGIAAEFEGNSQAFFRPDYSRSVAEVYVMATAFVINFRGDLACLTHVCDSTLKKIRDLPSWCPDYSASVPPLIDMSDNTRTWRLGLSWSDAAGPEIFGKSILRVDAVLFDIVAEVSTLDGKTNSGNRGLSALFHLACRLEDRDASSSTPRYDIELFVPTRND